MNINYAVIIYLIIINIFAVIITIADKYKAKKGLFRISENFLLTTAFFGGAVAEYVTMRVIHHKTRHKKFMLGLPLIILIQIAVIILVLYISKL